MGLTPLEGLAIVGFLAAKENLAAEAVEKLLNYESGMVGVSGVSGDMRQLLGAGENERARLAVEMFCYRARKYVGAYLAAMGGADAVVFTGGIGENSPEARASICEGLGWAGLTLDRERNLAPPPDRRISTDGSRLEAYCIATDEELLIARDTARCVLGERQLW